MRSMEAFCWWLFTWFVCSDFLISRCRRGLVSSPFDPRYVAYISITLVTLPVVPSFGSPSPVIHHCETDVVISSQRAFLKPLPAFLRKQGQFPAIFCHMTKALFQLECKFKPAECFLETSLISVISYSLGSKYYRHYRLST